MKRWVYNIYWSLNEYKHVHKIYDMKKNFLIAAVSDNDVIGVNNTLPWRLPKDLKFFKMNTFMGVVIMGRKTWDSLPKRPLPNRLNIILSREPRDPAPNVLWVTSVKDAIHTANHYSSRIYIIGGQDIFTQAICYVDTFILTRVHTHIEARSAKYLVLPLNKRLVWSSKLQTHKNLTYTFEVWSRTSQNFSNELRSSESSSLVSDGLIS